MREISNQKLHEFLETINKEDQDQIEELFFSLWSLHKMQGNIELPLEDFQKMKKLLLEEYWKENKDTIEWSLLLSGYFTRYHKYDEALQLLDKALEDSQERYHAECNSVSAIEAYATTLFYLAEFYLKEKKNLMLSLAYYTKCYEILITVDKTISEKIIHYTEWLQDISKNIDKLICENTSLLEQKIYVCMINGKSNYMDDIG